ncbi:putative FAD dependent oxidoreductase domain-containing protein [Seiridium unicorne]|uniref:FAD dependent oxidoreductase domain-containing protein n=1 Tax=Seiridium unicorne TaxID=138068 RepID=A0ABR2V0J9_9PEZI
MDMPKERETEVDLNFADIELTSIKTVRRNHDVAMIGSGTTGFGVAISLLKNDPSIRITVSEARGLRSGATGRNGRQLAITAAESYEENRERVGLETAGEIV